MPAICPWLGKKKLKIKILTLLGKIQVEGKNHVMSLKIKFYSW